MPGRSCATTPASSGSPASPSSAGWRWPLAAPRRWTPIFFLDDAVALAAGHRPCGLCRREAYRSYRDAVTAAVGSSTPLSAGDLNRRLASERLARGRGVDRARDRRRWDAPVASLPPGTVIVSDDLPAVAAARGSSAPLHLRRVGTSEPPTAPGDGAGPHPTHVRGGTDPRLHPAAAPQRRGNDLTFRPGHRGQGLDRRDNGYRRCMYIGIGTVVLILLIVLIVLLISRRRV